ncbi:MAG: MFS transporter [Paludibacteraceae bacterium]|nr:MFS transporter [Paludibacteraceae bacterium]
MEKLWNSEYLKVWGSNFLMNFAFWLLTPLLPLYLTDTYGANKEVIGLVLSGYAAAALLIRPFSGYLVDSLPRKLLLLVCYGLTAIFFGLYMAAGSLALFAIFRTLHGAPFGATGVSLTTVAIDVLPSSRRAEGIGYFGLSNNIATAISPSIALLIFSQCHSYNVLFVISLGCALLGLALNSTLHLKDKSPAAPSTRQPISLDRFFLLKAWALFIVMFSCAFAYSVLSTYVAIYGRERLGITTGTGIFFALFAIGLIVARLLGGHSLAKGLMVRNASLGMLVSICGFTLFAGVHQEWAYYVAPFVIGLGNGHIWPAFQNMFLNLAPNCQRGTANSTLLTSWDLGMGVGMLIGGSIAERFGYYTAFWTGVGFFALGIAFFFLFAKKHYLTHKLQ